MTKFYHFALAAITCIAPLSAVADGDYDGDGTSDFVVAAVDRRSDTTSFYVHTTAGTRIDYRVSAAGDALVPGDFNGDGKTQPAVVKVRTIGDLEWHTFEADGTQTQAVFGINGDRPLVGDFDCDGKDDRIVTREIGSTLHWFVSFSTGTMADMAYGLKGDIPWVGDIDGNDCDEMVLLRRKNNAQYWIYKHYGVRSATEVQWGALHDAPMRPYDINGDGRDDFIVVRRIGSQDWAFVRYSTTENHSFMLGATGSIIVVGDFNADGYGDFVRYVRGRRSTDMTQFLINPAAARPIVLRFGRTSHILVRPDGTVVQPTEGSTSSGSSSGGCSVTKTFSDGGGGALWKPVSESTGRPVFLLPGAYYSRMKSINIVARNGSSVASAKKRPYLANGNRAHFDVTKTASALNAYKPLTVKLQLTDNSVECRTIAEPSRRYD